MAGKGGKGLLAGKTPAGGGNKDKVKKGPTSRSSRAGLQVGDLVLGVISQLALALPLASFLSLASCLQFSMRIVLRNEKKLHHLEEALLEAPPATATAVVHNAYTCRVAEQQEVVCLMLVSMTLEIQKNLEDRTAFEILQELKTMFQQQAEQEQFETVKAFHACKQEEGQSISTYVLKMKSYLDQIERLSYPMPLVLGVNLILTSLSKVYDQFVQNYNMHDIGKTIPELHAMLKLAEKSIPKKAPTFLAIRQVQIQKPKLQARGKRKKRGKGKSKSKLAYDPKHKISHLLKRSILIRKPSVTTVTRLDTGRGIVLYIWQS
nr:zinc finger, CCHC-type [Tanacetum cinerariifolium]